MTEWRDISSAPTEKLVLVFDEGYIGKGILSSDGRWLDVEAGREDAFFDPAPTHWMHLPVPPLYPADTPRSPDEPTGHHTDEDR